MTRNNNLKEDIYQSKSVIRNYSKVLFGNPEITENNKRTIQEFLQHLEALGLSTRRVAIYLRSFACVAPRTSVSFRDIDEKEMKRIWAGIEQSGFKAWTTETYKKTIKVFFRWLYKIDSSDPLPPAVKWLRGKNPPSTIKKADLLSQEEFERMVNFTDNVMLKAMLSIQWETAVRPGELLNLSINDCDLTTNENHATITTRGKMEKRMGPRDVFIIKSKDFLKEWIEKHPDKRKDSPLWLCRGGKNNGRPATLAFYANQLKTLARRARIDKNVTPYLIRHSRATTLHLLYGSAIASKMLGHEPDSRMGRVYLHLDQQDVLAALQGTNGGPGLLEELKRHERKSTCPSCGHVNFFDRVFCVKCGHQIRKDVTAQSLLESDKIKKLLKIVDLLEDDPEVMDIMESKEWQRKQADKLAKKENG